MGQNSVEADSGQRMKKGESAVGSRQAGLEAEAKESWSRTPSLWGLEEEPEKAPHKGQRGRLQESKSG